MGMIEIGRFLRMTGGGGRGNGDENCSKKSFAVKPFAIEGALKRRPRCREGNYSVRRDIED